MGTKKGGGRSRNKKKRGGGWALQKKNKEMGSTINRNRLENRTEYGGARGCAASSMFLRKKPKRVTAYNTCKQSPEFRRRTDYGKCHKVAGKQKEGGGRAWARGVGWMAGGSMLAAHVFGQLACSTYPKVQQTGVLFETIT